MTDRPILRFLDSRPVSRRTQKAARFPQPQGVGHQRQGERFHDQFKRLEAALASENAALELRSDPYGIAPERALVFVTAIPIANFARAARLISLEVLSEIELEEDYNLPEDLIVEHQSAAPPTLYATMPTQDAFNQLLSLWRKYQNGETAPRNYAPWWRLFGMLAELRPWGPEDRFSLNHRIELENILFDDAEVRLELEHWPTQDQNKLKLWRRETEEKIDALGGRIIDRAAIHEEVFIYDAMLIGLAGSVVRDLIDNPSAPNGLATLDGLQFILPQTISQSLPSQSQPREAEKKDFEGFDMNSDFRVLLLDGTPVAGHRFLDGGVAIEDVHGLVNRSTVVNRRHATEMASLIMRGDIEYDCQPVDNSRLLAIPLLIDTEENATSPNDRLFVDLVHTALQRTFRGKEPLAPHVFVVNFSIGINRSNFAGRISSLTRLLDWWANKEGILFVVSAGNVPHDLEIPSITSVEFENLSLSERQELIRTAKRQQRHEFTLLAPSEALNALTVGAASVDLTPPPINVSPNAFKVQEDKEITPAMSTGLGLGPFRAIKPDLIGIGGYHEIRALPEGKNMRLSVVPRSLRTGLTVAAASSGTAQTRSRGTSCAAALVTRALLNAAAALTEEGGPYYGLNLSRNDLALLTRALAVNAARWPEAANKLYNIEKERLGGQRHRQAAEEVARHFGHGFLDSKLMHEAPLHGVTLVGLGQVKKDKGTIFDMPLPPSLSGDSVHRSMLVTLAWFSPVEPRRARYRLAALEAIAADGDMMNEEEEDKEWYLAMKSEPPGIDLIKRGTVWSRRMVDKRFRAPQFNDEATLPIRVQCRDASGGGLNPDEAIPFSIAVTLQLEETVNYDVYQEIRDRLLIRLRGESSK